MYAVIGSTGQVGGAVVRALLAQGKEVRALHRDAGKGADLEKLGAEPFHASVEDPSRLEAALDGVEGVFVMTPPLLDSPDPRVEHALALAGIKHALQAAHAPRVVLLSSYGAQHAEGTGLILKLYDMEQELMPLPLASAAIRACYFMENLLPQFAAARESGRLPSTIEPLDLPIPMIATKDIGQLAARLLGERWEGERILELEGPRRYSMQDAAAVFAALLQRPVEATVVPEGERLAMFEGFGLTPVAAREMIEMTDGISRGHVAFAGGPGVEHVRGETTLESVLGARA